MPDGRMAEFDELLDWVSEKTGLSFRNQRAHAVDAFRREMQAADCESVNEYRRWLLRDQAAFDRLVGELTIGETYFFRDERQFRLVQNDFLPAMQKIRPADHTIRLWSAGCASGEEAWSLAISLSQAGYKDRSRVLATDISMPALQKARNGVYRPWSLRGAAKQLMQNWIEDRDGSFVIRSELRSRVDFEYLNFADDSYPSAETKTIGLDMIICRNVLIYFDEEMIRQVAQKFFRCLNPGGWLLTGASDPLLSNYADFETLTTTNGLVCVRPQQQSPSQTSVAHPQLPEMRKPTAAAESLRQDVVAPVTPPAENISCSTPGDVSAKAREAEELESRIARVRQLANLDLEQAEVYCKKACDDHPTSEELHYLHAILLTELEQFQAASAAAKRAVFLNRELIVGHFALASVYLRLKDNDAAARSFRNAERLCRACPTDEPVWLSDGEHAGGMAETAARQLQRLTPVN